MDNGHVQIHDPISSHNGVEHCDPRSTSDPDSMEDTVELRLLMAYAKRRRPKAESSTQDSPIILMGGTDANGSASPHTPPAKTKTEEKKKKKGWKRVKRIFSCIKPQTTDEEPKQTRAASSGVDDRCGDFTPIREKAEEEEEEEEEDELQEVVSKLERIANDVPFTPPELEADTSEDDVNVEKMIGLILRETGDRFNEKELKDASISTELFWNYDFFKRLMTTLLTRMGLMTPDPDSPGPKAHPETQIAVTCEVTTRLSEVNTLPGDRLLSHGARYLQQYYSPWAQQQGGYGEAFYSDDEDDSH